MSKRIPASLTALGRNSPPEAMIVQGHTYRLRQVFKNDFFAVTAMYEGIAGRIILKAQREAPMLWIPLRWLGRILASREWSALSQLQDVPGIPRLIERISSTRFIREYVEGHAMQTGERVADDFHEQLALLIQAIHSRGMAYVDLEKCENVLVGDDGRPYLVDFQIAWIWPRSRGGELWPMRLLRAWLQRGDLYHLIKLKRRTRPDLLSPQELAASYQRPWFVRWHRRLTYPFTYVRRRILDRIDPRRGRHERGRLEHSALLSGANE